MLYLVLFVFITIRTAVLMNSIDHIAIVVDDPKKAAEKLARQFGDEFVQAIATHHANAGGQPCRVNG